jgi:uncharacterized protein YdeI (YjbR/CyaY-like superfamily)
LKDIKGILIQQTENVQAARQIRFTNFQEIVDIEPVLKAYIKQALEVEKAGLEMKFKQVSEFKIPQEFQNKFHSHPTANKEHGWIDPSLTATRRV